MGNQQPGFNYSLGGYYEDNNSDSGFYDPSDYLSNSVTQDVETDSSFTIENTSTPKKIGFKLKNIKETDDNNETNLVNTTSDDNEIHDEKTNKLASIKHYERASYLRKSKSIGINKKNEKKSLKSASLDSSTDNSILNSSEEEELREELELNELKLSSKNNLYSSTWSQNSNIKHSKSLIIETKTKLQTEPEDNSYSFSLKKGMDYIGRVARGVKEFYNEINPATLTGAIDVVVVQQEDGSFRCSPFHVRFGKMGIIRSKETMVDIEINGEPVDLHMKLGEAGEAYFVEEVTDSEDDSSSCESIPNSLKISKTTSDLKTLKKSSESSMIKAAQSIDNLAQTEFNLSESPKKKVTISESLPITRDKSTSDLLKVTSLSVSPNMNDPTVPVDPNGNNIAESATIKIPNFFSDGELTPELTSPAVSRPPTPKSDTELEVTNKLIKHNSISQSDNANQWSWRWGQLPERQNSITKKSDLIEKIEPKETVKNSQSTSLLGGMFNLMANNAPNGTTATTTKASKKLEGVYLDETDKLDSEVAALYINQKNNATQKLTVQTNQQTSKNTNGVNKVDDDQESGNGQSLPQSPRDCYSILGDVQISLCGFLTQTSNSNLSSPNPSSVPLSSLVPKTPVLQNESNFLAVPHISQTQNLSPSLSTSSLLTVSPSTTQSNLSGLSSPSNLDSSLFFNTSNTNQIHIQLPQQLEQSNVHFDDLFQQNSISFEKFLDEMTTLIHNPNLVVKINNRYLNWSSASPIILSAIVYHRQLTNEQVNAIVETNMAKIAKQSEQQQQQQSTQEKSQTQQAASSNSKFKNLLSFSWSKKPTANSTGITSSPSTTSLQSKTTTTSTTTTTTISTVNVVETKQTIKSNNDDYNLMMDEDIENENMIHSELIGEDNYYQTKKLDHKNKKKFKKTTRLSSELIKKLNLNPGSNEIKYSVTTALQGTSRITSYIFLWNYDDKIIVSDVDGTITKSDVWGQVLPLFGRDWTQTGVADLFTAIQRNQYKFMYLSARAIGQSQITRNLLQKINQDGFRLPEGPLLVTPTSLFQAFQKEVIERKPEEFKISCLKDIQSLFPINNNPFYAGYGNRTSDVTSYKTVGIPISRIFTINPQGEVKHEVSRTFQSSYSKLCDYVDLIFPPFKASKAEIKTEYDSFNYWRNSSVSDLILNEIEQEIKTSQAQTKESKDTKDKKLKVQASSLNLSKNV